MITEIDKNTALILIDLQNSIVGIPGTPNSMNDVFNNVNKLIQTFREKQLPIVFVNVNPSDAAWMKSRKETKMPPFPANENSYNITDKINTDKNDVFITKHTWNAFFETQLHNELKKRSITNIVLGGVSTSIGVEGTARAASELGYNVTFATDATTDRLESSYKHSVETIFPRIGEKGTTKEIIDIMNKEV